jgi:hypothetical protein
LRQLAVSIPMVSALLEKRRLRACPAHLVVQVHQLLLLLLQQQLTHKEVGHVAS